MTKAEKLYKRLACRPLPTDFRWEELVSVMREKGCELSHRNGGSHCYFVHTATGMMHRSCKPHPNNICKIWQLEAALQFLNDVGEIEGDASE